MLRVTKGKGEPKTRVRFAGICADARALGVSREHLFRVLSGQRQSRSLLQRYRELKQSKAIAQAQRDGADTAAAPPGRSRRKS